MAQAPTENVLTFKDLPADIVSNGRSAVELWKQSVALWKDTTGNLTQQHQAVGKSDRFATESAEAWGVVETLCQQHQLDYPKVKALVEAHFSE